MAEVASDVCVALLRQYGSFPQAYSATFQPGLEHFGDADGFLAFKRIAGTALVLADPIARPERHQTLIDEFVRAFRDVCFCQISRPTAELLAARGFWINEMGFETRLDLPALDFKGRKYQNWRKATNRTAEQGIVVRECSMAAIDVDAIDRISRRWRRTRPIKNREICFITRPIVLRDELDVRKFFAFDADGNLLAFNFFDPVYSGGRIVAYMDQFKRRLPDADPLLNYAIQRHAIEVFRDEGRDALFLGIAPFAEIHDKDFANDWLVKRGFRFAFENWVFNRFLYPLKGLAAHKSRCGGVPEQTYFAFNTPPSFPRLIKLARACRILPF